MSTASEGFINEVNVTNAFQFLKLKSSSGHDGLSNLALKYAARELSAISTDLSQLLIRTGVLPDSWRFYIRVGTSIPLRENAHWMLLLRLRFRPFCPDHSETYLRALLIMERPWASLQGWPLTTSSAYLRKETNESEKRSEV